jgi:flagellar biogenesis protein FliO
MVGLICIVVFILVWIWIFYQLYKAPLIEDDENLIDLEDDEEFLG